MNDKERIAILIHALWCIDRSADEAKRLIKRYPVTESIVTDLHVALVRFIVETTHAIGYGQP